MCEKRPKKLPTMAQYYWHSRRKFKNFWQKKIEPSIAGQAELRTKKNAASRGHAAYKTDIKMYGAEKCKKVGSTWICTKCLSSNIGWSAKVFYNECPGKVTLRTPSIWSQAKQQGLLQTTLDAAGLDAVQRAEIEEWIEHYEMGKLKSLPKKSKAN